jgi:hypothetical protein
MKGKRDKVWDFRDLGKRHQSNGIQNFEFESQATKNNAPACMQQINPIFH